jgi:hypothetical protein
MTNALNIIDIRIFSGICAVFLFSAPPIFADSKIEKKANEATAKDNAFNNSTEKEMRNKNKSLETREDKYITIVGEYGFIDVLHYGYGFHSGLFVSPDVIIEVNSFSAKAKNSIRGEFSKISLETIRTKYCLGKKDSYTKGFRTYLYNYVPRT